MRSPSMVAALPAVLVILSASLAGQAFVRTHDDHREWRAPRPGSVAVGPTSDAAVCSTASPAWHSQSVPGGGSLSPLAFMNPATANRDGRIAFHARVDGAVRNQGIFVADATGLRPIAIGCGQGGGSGNHGTCGDPAPGGGTFAGFFGGTMFAPASNARGDVLFVADVAGGPSPRGLFLWRADVLTIVKVAAIGDPAPNGGTFTAIGPGSLNNSRDVVFLGRNTNVLTSDVYSWRNGALGTHAKTGDPAPGGGTFTMLGTESLGFVDNTNIPTGPVPAINDRGEIAFRAIASGPVSRGIVLSRHGQHQWVLRAGDPTPAGGTYVDFWAPCLNQVGQVALLADFTPSTSGWFVGAPGSWRKAIAFYDAIDGGSCLGLAVSRNPMTPLDDDGNLTFWANLSSSGDQDRLVASAPDGSLTIVARRGGATPLGGTFTMIDAWPSSTPTGRVSFGAGTPGAGGGAILNARFVSVLCGPAVSADGAAYRGGSLRVDDWGPAGASFGLFLSTGATSRPLPPMGTLRIGPSPILAVLGLTPYPAGHGLHTSTVAVPNDAALAGIEIYWQSLAVQGTGAVLTNRSQTLLR